MLQVKNNDYNRDIDRMINEGLGGGFIIYDYNREQLHGPEISETDSHRRMNIRSIWRNPFQIISNKQTLRTFG